MQYVKQVGMEFEELVLVDFVDWLVESWEDGVCYVFGLGLILYGLVCNFGLEIILLGVDVLENGVVFVCDVDEVWLFELVDGYLVFLLVIVIGGQGYVIGCGNQQISFWVLCVIGLECMWVVVIKCKLGIFGGWLLLVDSGDLVLDDSFLDVIWVWVGYKEELLYLLGYVKDQDVFVGVQEEKDG